MKMVAALLLASTLCLASSSSPVERRDVHGTRQTDRDLPSIFKWCDLSKVAIEYLYRDPEVQDFVRYLGSQDFKDIVRELDGTSEYQEMLTYLTKAGFNAVKFHNVVHTLLGLPTLPVEEGGNDLVTRGGMLGLLRDLADVVGSDQLIRWYSAEWFTSVTRLPHQPFVKTLVAKLTKLPQMNTLISKLVSLGLAHKSNVHLNSQ